MAVIERFADPPAELDHIPQERLRDVPAELARNVGLLGFTMALAAVFWWMLGAPHLPASLPSLDQVRDVLMGSELPEPLVIEGTALVGWALFAYLLVVLVLRLLVLVIVSTVGATRAVRGAVRLIDLVTLPPVRRLTDGALAGVLMTSAWLSPPAKARASVLSTTRALPPPTAPAPELTTMPLVAVAADASSVLDVHNVPFALAPQRMALTYTVVRGDTLWRIAERLYGDGRRFADIAAANAGREVAPGVVFGDPDVLQPGWELLVPLPAEHVELDTAGMTYTVQEGDSLWGIAARLLGDGQRWREVWDRNHWQDMGDGRRFTNPGILLAGWTLRLPGADVVPVPEPPAVPAPAPLPELPAPPPTAERPVASPSPMPPAVNLPEPALPGNDDGDDNGLEWLPTRSPREVAVAVAAGAAAAGVAALAAHRHRTRRTSGGGGHATDGASSGRHRRRRSGPPPGDLERVERTARIALVALHTLGCAEVRLLGCREEREAVTLQVACMPGEAQALVNVRFTLGRRLGCVVDACAVADQLVELTITGLRREAAALLPDTAASAPALLPVPVGADDAGIHYLNLAGLASVGVRGTETAIRSLLRGWLATLAATPTDDSYRIAALEGEVRGLVTADLPLWRDLLPQTASDLLAAIEAEMAGRLAGAESTLPPPLILVMLGVDNLDDADRLNTLVRRGREANIHLVLWERDGGPDVPEHSTAQACEAAVTSGGAADGDDIVMGMMTLRLMNQAPVLLHPVAIPEGQGVPEPRPSDAGSAAVSASIGADSHYCSQVASLPLHKEPRDVPTGHLMDSGADDAIEETPPADAAVGPYTDRLAAVQDDAEREDLQPVGANDKGRAPAAAALAAPDPEQSIARQLTLADDDTIESESDSSGERVEPRITVRCLGGFEVELRGTPISNWKSVKARELLAYLIAHGETPVPREDAWAALWPDGEPGQMQRLLSSAAYHLRRTIKEALGEEAEPLITQDARYRLRSALFHVDLTTFNARLHRATILAPVDALIEYERALALYRGRLFGAEPFDWAGGYRQDYENRFQAAAHRAAQLAVQCRDLKRAATFYQVILHREPTDEEAARGVMSCLAAQGDRAGVRKVYKALVEALRRELDEPAAQPLPETVALLRQLLGDS